MIIYTSSLVMLITPFMSWVITDYFLFIDYWKFTNQEAHVVKHQWNVSLLFLAILNGNWVNIKVDVYWITMFYNYLVITFYFSSGN